VRQNLIDLRGVDLDLAKTIVEIQLEPRAADESPEDRLEAPYEGIELYHLQVQVLAPRERKQLPCQVPGTGGSALNRRGFLDHCRWQVLLEDLLGGRDNDGKHVVEVMCDATSEPAYGFELFCAPLV